MAGFSDLKERRAHVLSLLPEGTLAGLDHWKQSGFYCQLREDSFLTPQEAIEPGVAEAVYRLAWRVATLLDFVLKDGNLQRYIDRAREIRTKLSEDARTPDTAE